MLPIVYSKPTPVFVIGKHRSGTTGLANHLCEHSEISGVQHEKHWGIHESGYYAYVAGRYGSLKSWSNFREFVEVMSASDYFQLAGIEKEYMISLWPTTYADFFRSVMDEFARRRGTSMWLEKSPAHTKRALWLAEQYPQSRFVAIIRNVGDVAASSLFHSYDNGKGEPEPAGLKRFSQVARVVAGWVYYNKSIYALHRQYPSRVTILKYGSFVQNKQNILNNVCSFLNVDFDEKICTPPYSRNTSFSDEKTRSKSMTETERRYARRLADIFEKIPYSVYWVLDNLADRLEGKSALPSWFFRISSQK